MFGTRTFLFIELEPHAADRDEVLLMWSQRKWLLFQRRPAAGGSIHSQVVIHEI